MTSIKFEDYKVRITEAIQTRLRQTPITGENGFTLIEGFIMQPLSNEAALIIGGPTVPLVAIVGNTTGRVYYFALKALQIPNLEI